jgi:eukaryotic-like serine/threonine-protein kinase
LSGDDEKPIALREVCERCSRPIFPTRPGSTASILHRPGFCNCALQDALKKTNEMGKDPLGMPPPASDSAIAKSNQNGPPDTGPGAANQEENADPGFKIKLPTGTAEVPKFPGPDARGNNRLTQSDIVRPPGSKFDPNIQLPDLIEEGYTFFDRVGKGTMGYVYQAKSEHLDALLAIKIFHRAPFKNKRTLKRLEQEASVALGISHPHLASVYKFGISQKEYPYIVMDFMAGPTLAEVLLQEGFLDTTRALDVFIQIAEGLEYAHEEKLLHRGLKPNNIYVLVSTGGRDFIKVSDFGIAKVLPNPGRETKYMTPQGEEFGNPNYMSPEQCLGNRLDARSDIYSFGCIMYECLSGKVPHGSSNAMRVAFKQVSEEAKSLIDRFTDLDIPKDLDNVILACLEKNPEDRFRQVKDLRLALEAVRDNKKPRLPSAVAFSGSKSIKGGHNLIDKLLRPIKIKMQKLIRKSKSRLKNPKTNNQH